MPACHEDDGKPSLHKSPWDSSEMCPSTHEAWKLLLMEKYYCMDICVQLVHQLKVRCHKNSVPNIPPRARRSRGPFPASSDRSREVPDTSCSSVADGSRQTGVPFLLRNGVGTLRIAEDPRCSAGGGCTTGLSSSSSSENGSVIWTNKKSVIFVVIQFLDMSWIR